MISRTLVLSTVALLALLAGGCVEKPEAVANTTTALPEDVAAVADVAKPVAAASSEGATSAALSATGEFLSPSQSDLSPKFPGRVAAVYVDEGSRVKAGQPLLALETTYAALTLRQAEADLARATAAADEARRELERKKELHAKESIPQALLDRAQAGYEQAAAARAAAEAGVATARQRLSDSVLRSPMTGAVAARRVDVGEFLGDGAVPFVIMQTAPLKLRFQVAERQLGAVREGQRVTATVDPYPGVEFTGRIRTVGQVIDPATRTFFVEAEFANADGRLRPGLFARVEAGIE